MQSKSTWVLVSNGDNARIFAHNSGQMQLAALDYAVDLIDEEEPVKTASSCSIADMRSTNHNLELSDADKQRLAHKLAEFLDKNTGEFEQLVMVAPAQMLRFLREKLSKQQMERTIAAIEKDLVSAPEAELTKHLQKVINIDANRTTHAIKKPGGARAVTGASY